MNQRATPRTIGNIVAPWRFIVFVIVAVIEMAILIPITGWRHGVMISFDMSAIVFLLSCIPLFNDEAELMRQVAERNDANRALLLVISASVMTVTMVAVASELIEPGKPAPHNVMLIIASLAMSWLFANTVYALHYAHLYYTQAKEGGDLGGLEFPDTKEPDYWDFIYFSFCLGMTFQTSDTEMRTGRFRRVSTFHCLAAFVFNIGVIAFTINVLGGGK